ncbi:MAG: DUF2652 domain-containing protein, partial [Saprospiraceae bacterium]|nr:DUF2652 domain-containing protein [Saprospiraceae bacterium]
RFIKQHRISLLHAEKIIGELMEAILDQVETPVVAHEILGDAVSLYAEDSGEPGMADNIYAQTLKYFASFQEKEAMLVSDCQICECSACLEVGKLKLKAILHAGKAAFTRVRDIRKISGEPVILAHRLLKNSIPSDEYIIMTRAFADRCTTLPDGEDALVPYTEQCEGIGPVEIMVRNFEEREITPVPLSRFQKFRKMMKLTYYTSPRVILGKAFPGKKKEFRNLPV